MKSLFLSFVDAIKFCQDVAKAGLTEVAEAMPQPWEVNVTTFICTTSIPMDDGEYKDSNKESGMCRLMHFLNSKNVDGGASPTPDRLDHDAVVERVDKYGLS